MLADEIIVADFEKAWLPPEFDVLRFAPEHRMFENAVSLSQGGGTLHYCMCAEFSTGSDSYVILDNAIWTNGNVSGNLCGIGDNGCRVYVTHCLFEFE
jgi:hypothetical protein